MQNSGDYKKVASSLKLDWVGAGKAALNEAAQHGQWKTYAGPIFDVILTLVGVAAA